MNDPINPLTAREAVLAELVGRGYSVKEIVAALPRYGFQMAHSTVVTRLRDVANKVPNPHELPTMAAIKSWWRSRNPYDGQSTAA